MFGGGGGKGGTCELELGGDNLESQRVTGLSELSPSEMHPSQMRMLVPEGNPCG